MLHFKDLELHTIELKKFSANANEELSDLIAKVKSSLDIWVAFLTRHDLLNKDQLPASIETPALKKALMVLDVMNFAEEERQAYEEHLKWLRIEANTLKKYEKKGFAEGEAQGFVKGKAETLQELVKKLIEKGTTLQEVAELTSLSIAELEKI